MILANCIILDDEPLARTVLEEYILLSPKLKLSGICKNAADATDILLKNKVDLIFCDIQMPGTNGLQFLNSLEHLPKIIITSAFREYAIEGFQIGVVDYLLKPFSFDRFTLAISRAIGEDPKTANQNNSAIAPDFLFFKVGNSIEKVFVHQICFVEAYGNYCKLFLNDTSKLLIVNSKISDLEKELDTKLFIRVHKSYLINLNYIQKITTNKVVVREQHIPISDSYKKNFQIRVFK